MTIFNHSCQSHFVTSSEKSDLSLHLRHVAPPKEHDKNQAVLFVHGAVLASILFDVPVKGSSWLTYFAEKGFYSFALDLRGYGLSSKEKVIEEAEKNGQFACSHEEALRDIFDAIQHIRTTLGVEQVVLCGLSWGGLLAGAFAQRYPNFIEKLVLLGPVYRKKNPVWGIFMDPEKPTQISPNIGFFREVKPEELMVMWDAQIPVADKNTWRNCNVENTIREDFLASDEIWAKANNVNAVRMPTGVLNDIVSLYNEIPLYEAKEVACPTLILRGEYDTAALAMDAQCLFEELGSKEKYFIQMGQATHYGLVEAHVAPLMMRHVYEFLVKE